MATVDPLQDHTESLSGGEEETRKKKDGAKPRSQQDSRSDELQYQEVTVEYIRENDFAEHRKREYRRISSTKPLHHGKGYYIGKTVVNVPAPRARSSTRKRLDDPREIPDLLQRKWSHIFKEKGSLVCPIKSCGRTFVSLAGALSHYKWCAGTVLGRKTEHVCGQCRVAFKTKKILHGHLLNCSLKKSQVLDPPKENAGDSLLGKKNDAANASDVVRDCAEDSAHDPRPAVKLPQIKALRSTRRSGLGGDITDSDGTSDLMSDQNDSDCAKSGDEVVRGRRRASVKRRLLSNDESGFTSINKKTKRSEEPSESMSPVKLSPRKGRGVPPKRLIACDNGESPHQASVIGKAPVTSTPVPSRLEETSDSPHENILLSSKQLQAVKKYSGRMEMPSPISVDETTSPSKHKVGRLKSSRADNSDADSQKNANSVDGLVVQSVEGDATLSTAEKSFSESSFKHPMPMAESRIAETGEIEGGSSTGQPSTTPVPLPKTRGQKPSSVVSPATVQNIRSSSRRSATSSESSDDERNETSTPMRKRWRLRIRPGQLSEVAIKEEPEDDFIEGPQSNSAMETNLCSPALLSVSNIVSSDYDTSVSSKVSKTVSKNKLINRSQKGTGMKNKTDKTITTPVRQSPRRTRSKVVYKEDTDEEFSEVESQPKQEIEDEDFSIVSASGADVSCLENADDDDTDDEISFRTIEPSSVQESEADELADASTIGEKENSDSTVAPSPLSGSKRGRGRGKTQTKTRGKKTPADAPASSGKNKVWTCMKCSQEYATATSLKQHVAREHHLVWSQEHPEGVQDMRALFNLIGRCYCTRCGKEVRYYTYFQFHMEWCGREHETELCSVCNKPVRSMYIVQHMRTHRISAKMKKEREQKANQAAEALNEPPTEGRVRRKAAQKAMEHLRHLEVEMEAVKRMTQREIPIKRRYSTPFERQFTPVRRKQFQEELAKTGKIKCIFKGCAYTTDKPDSMAVHLGQCRQPLPDIGTFKCLKCSKEFLVESAARAHVITPQCWKDVMEYESDNDEGIDDTDEDPDVDISEDDDEEADIAEEELMSSGDDEDEGDSLRSRTQPHLKGVSQYNMDVPLSRSNQFVFDDMMMWTISWYKHHDHTNLFPSWKPRKNKWKPLPRHEMSKYLPESGTSPDIVIKGGDNNITVDASLGLFETTKSDPHVWNAGGPVWSLAWCPTPLGFKARQYLAVYCHRKQDDLHLYDEISSSASLIQLWDHGDPRTKEEPGVMCLGIAHDVGAVWEMKWCPYGVWQSPLNATSSVFYPRLGLLAAACGDGKIYIYCIPHPEFLKHEDYHRRICRTEPEVVLHTSFNMHAGESSPCLCVDWQWADGCGRIMAGYGDGRIHVWDLNTESMLLRVETNNGMEIIRPTQGFQAHASCINSISICQRMPNYLVSVSHDRHFKIWDLHHTDTAINSSTKMLMKSVQWPLHWPVVYGAGDDCYCLEHNSSFMADLGYFGFSLRPLTVHNSTIWDIDKSEWINTVCAVDAAGEVETMPLPYLVTVNKNHKGFTVRRALVLSTQIETKEDAVKEEGDEANEKDETNVCQCGLEVSHEENAMIESELTQSFVEVCPMCQRLRYERKRVIGEVREVVPVEESTSEATIFEDSFQEGDRPHVVQPTPTDKGPPDRLQEYNLMRGVNKLMQNSRIVYRDKKLSKLTSSDRPKLTFSNALRNCKPDVFPLQALYQVRWNPNLGYHTRLALGGQVGLVRHFNLTCYDTSETQRLTEAEFAANDEPSSTQGPPADEALPSNSISR